MSSDIFSCKRDYTKFSLFYAAAQKNLGVAGVTMVAISREMLNKQVRSMPGMLDYKEHVKENSVLNTANVFGIYISLLMLRWIKAKGLDEIEKENKQKAKQIYDALDNSRAFITYIKEPAHRSMMNICFFAKKPEVETMIYKMCEEHNITGIQGHRSIGGFRVSLYNAISFADTQKFVDILKVFG